MQLILTSMYQSLVVVVAAEDRCNLEDRGVTGHLCSVKKRIILIVLNLEVQILGDILKAYLFIKRLDCTVRQLNL